MNHPQLYYLSILPISSAKFVTRNEKKKGGGKSNRFFHTWHRVVSKLQTCEKGRLKLTPPFCLPLVITNSGHNIKTNFPREIELSTLSSYVRCCMQAQFKEKPLLHMHGVQSIQPSIHPSFQQGGQVVSTSAAQFLCFGIELRAVLSLAPEFWNHAY